MCFGGSPKMPKTPTALKIPMSQPAPVQPAVTQSGADQSAKTTAPRRKSLFQIDLQIPSVGAGGSNPGVGANA